MESNTDIMMSAIFNALAELAHKDKEVVVEAFNNSMSHMDCGHKACENIGQDIAKLINKEDWQGLSDFFEYKHLEVYNEEVTNENK